MLMRTSYTDRVAGRFAAKDLRPIEVNRSNLLQALLEMKWMSDGAGHHLTSLPI